MASRWRLTPAWVMLTVALAVGLVAVLASTTMQMTGRGSIRPPGSGLDRHGRNSPPTLRGETAEPVTPNLATLRASINPGGEATSYWFEYGSSSTYGARTQAVSAGSGTQAVAVSATVTGLVPVSHYHYRVVASNCHGCQAGTALGRDATFMTDAYQNPVSGGIDAPDPFVLDVGDRHASYWAFATGKRFPVFHSTDLVHWRS